MNLLMIIVLLGTLVGMAKVTGPLFSLTASGKIGNAMVHFPWKGLNVVRQWLKPKNLESPDQGDVRIRLGGLGQATRCAGVTSLYRDDAKLSQDEGQTWVSSLVGYCFNNYMYEIADYEAIYTAFEAHAQKAVFTAQALLLELADFDVAYKGTAHVFSAGMQLYMLAKYGIAMRLAKEGVFNRAPYLTALINWAAGDPVLLKTDLLNV